jgi:hypothetical protein
LQNLGTESGKFELVAIGDSNPNSESNDGLSVLGFDIVGMGNWNSLLSWNWQKGGMPILATPPNLSLVSLMHRYFLHFLNTDGLFADEHSANECLTVVHAIAKLAPGTFETPEYERFKVLFVAIPVL